MAIFGIGRKSGLQRELEDAKQKNAYLKRAYAAAQNNRLTSDWISQATSADSEIRGSLRTLRNRARQLVRDSDFAKAALRAVRNNVVGTGIKLQAQVRMQRGGRLSEEVNKRIEEEFKAWSVAKICNTAGKLSFQDIQRLSITSMLESGEVFIRFVKQPFGGGRVPLALEVIESDLLDDDYSGIAENGNQIRMGVEINEWGRPVAYHFWDYHPGDYQFSYAQVAAKRRVRIPAEDVLHLYLIERPGQSRGVSAFASAIMRLRNLSGYEEAEIVAARASSAMMAFVKTPDQELFEDGTFQEDSVLDFSPGSIRRLAPGEEMQFFTPSRPDDAFTPFVQQMLRAVASVEMAVMAGVLDLPGYDSSPARYIESNWMAPASQFVDPQKEASAYKDLIRSGIMTLSQVIALHGGDFEDQMRQRQHELATADELGIVLDTDPSQVSSNGVSQSVPVPLTEHPADHDEEED
jgi:capsid protein